MKDLLRVEIGGEEMGLGNRYIRWGQILILADLHLGKTMHFRKSGMALPPEARKTDQTAFIALLDEEQPERVIILGDLFHSEANTEVEELAMITSRYSEVEFLLIKGNHDILSDADYRSLDMHTEEALKAGNLLLTHEPVEASGNTMNLHGHIHPGVVLRGKGRQRLKVPCFHLSAHHFCLPAFGALTGLMAIAPKRGDRVFGVIDGGVVELS